MLEQYNLIKFESIFFKDKVLSDLINLVERIKQNTTGT